MIYVIPGKPTAWVRAVPSRKQGLMFDSQKNKKLLDGIAIKQQHGNRPMLEGPLYLDVMFYMAIPESFSSKKQAQLEGQYHFKKPDIDNLEKYLCDMLTVTQKIFHDDCLIAKVSKSKVYDINPRTEFTVTKIA